MRCETRWLLLVTWALVVATACRPTAGQTAAPADPATDLAEMSPAEKKELQGKQERFYRLDPQTQDQLRQLHDELMRDPDSARLQAVLTRYASWLQTLSSGQRAELLTLPPPERVAEIKRLLQQQTASRMRSYVPRKLSDEDLQSIAHWVEQMVQRREPEILKKWPMFKDRLDGISDAKRRSQTLVFMVHRSGLHRDWLKPTPEDIESLKTALSAEAQQELEKAKAEGRLPELADVWLRAAMFSLLAGPPVDKEQLRRFFKEDLEPQDREFLESLPPERMQAELVRMYYSHRFRRDGLRDWPGFRKPGSGFRGPSPRFGPPGIREPNVGDRPPGAAQPKFSPRSGGPAPAR
jgi:hypothetical protein